MNYILHVAPAANHQGPNIIGTILSILLIAGFVTVVVFRLIHHLKKNNVLKALGKVFMDLAMFPPFLFAVLFFPALWLNNITNDWFNEHGWFSGITFLLIFFVCQVLVFNYHEKHKDD